MLKIEDIYWYDGPRLSVMQEVDGSWWLGVSIGDDFNQGDDVEFPGWCWPMFCVRVTHQIVDLVTEDQIDLYSAFKTGSDPMMYDYGTVDKKKSLTDSEIKDDWYPGEVTLRGA